MLTHKDIKQASSNLTLEALKRTATLRKLADALVKHYIESLELSNSTFINEAGKTTPYVDTYVDKHGKLELCLVGALPLDENFAINFSIRTATNDKPSYINHVDVHISIKIEEDNICIYLMDNPTPIITPLEPIDGQFEETATAIKQCIISMLNSRIPK